ncbi:hypothetical protein IJ425_02035 [bacterium]|nr:hypothetical protein [bacterium]
MSSEEFLKLTMLQNGINNSSEVMQQNQNTQSEITLNPFDVYKETYETIYGSSENSLDREAYDKVMLGELETDDLLLLNIIETANIDEDNSTISEVELDTFLNKLQTGELFVNQTQETSETQEIEEYLIEQQNQLTQAYLSKDSSKCTLDEINACYALSMIENLLLTSQEGLQAQDDADGWISEGFDWIKDVTGLFGGIAQSDVEEAIKKQDEILTTLTKTLQEGGDFAKVYKELTGVEYNPEKIADYYQKTTELQFVSIGMQKLNSFCETLKSDKVKYNPEKMLAVYIEFYGSEELGRENFEKDLIKSMEASGMMREPFYKEFEINEYNEFVYTYWDGTTKIEPVPVSMNNCITKYFRDDEFIQSKTNEYLTNFEKATGINYETLVQEQQQLSQEALGDVNAVVNLLNEYVASQEGFIDGLSTICQIGGMVCMGLGAVVSFIPVPGARLAGGAMMTAGKWAAIAGTFGDEALEILDTATNNQGWDEDKENYKQIAKDLFTDAALFASGYAAGAIGGAVGKYISSNGGAKALAKILDIGTDSAISLMSDLIITGEVDFKGEGLSQILSILTGTAAARLNAKQKADFDTANKMYQDGDSEGAFKYLSEQGYNKKNIQKIYGDTEAAKLLQKYVDTGDYNSVMTEANQSILSEKQITNLKTQIILKGMETLGFDITKFEGYDYNSPQGKLIAQDIEMVYAAKTQGVNVRDLMVPTKQSVEAGKNEINVGDLFEVNGKLYLKTSDTEVAELNISKYTYCNLFPAVERYASGQQASGDCYLISTLNAMMTNPKTRQNLLSCFSEVKNPDGTISAVVTMPDGTKVELNEGQTLKDLGIKDDEHVTGAFGVALLEFAYKKSLENQKKTPLQNSASACKTNLLIAFVQDYEYWNEKGIKTEEDFIKKASDKQAILENLSNINRDFNVTLEEMDLRYIGKYDEGNMTDIPSTNALNYIMQKTNVDSQTAIEIYKQIKEAAKMGLALYYADSASANQVKANAINFENEGGNGGYVSDAMQTFGIDAQKFYGNDFYKKMSDILRHPDSYENYLIAADTKETREDVISDYNDSSSSHYEYYHSLTNSQFREILKNTPKKLYGGDIVSNHAYSVYIVKNEEGRVEFEVINPWGVNSSKDKRSFTLTYDDFSQCFNSLYLGKIE